MYAHHATFSVGRLQKRNTEQAHSQFSVELEWSTGPVALSKTRLCHSGFLAERKTQYLSTYRGTNYWENVLEYIFFQRISHS